MVRSFVRVLVAAVAVGSGVACAEPVAKVVDATEARRLVTSGAKVVDVRTAAEFAMGHIPGAINIPFDELERRHGELGEPSAKVLLYCRSGRRSAIAAGTLKGKGFEDLYDLQAYDRWVASERAR